MFSRIGANAIMSSCQIQYLAHTKSATNFNCMLNVLSTCDLLLEHGLFP